MFYNLDDPPPYPSDWNEAPESMQWDPSVYYAQQAEKLRKGKRKWHRVPKAERNKRRLAEMWCRLHSQGDRHSQRLKRILNFLIGRYWGTV